VKIKDGIVDVYVPISLHRNAGFLPYLPKHLTELNSQKAETEGE
jgi:hypothetical protein